MVWLRSVASDPATMGRCADIHPLVAYTLTQCVFQLVFGNFYKLFTPKRTFLMSLLLFEVGSLLCGVAPTSLALIFGVSITCYRLIAEDQIC